MRMAEQLRIAWRMISWKRYIWLMLSSVLGMFFLLQGWELYQELKYEKNQPCQLTATEITGQGKDFSQNAAAISGISGVLEMTPVWDLSTGLTCRDYSTAITLYGVAGEYLEGEWLWGTAFPESSAMPYLVLNEAAVLALRTEKMLPLEDAVSLDWSRESVYLSEPKERAVRICGLLRDGEQEPRAYLSMEQVKSLRSENGVESPLKTLWIRLKNSGCREAVRTELAALGWEAFVETEQEDFLPREERSTLYLISGGVLLIGSLILHFFGIRIFRAESEDTLAAWERMGVSGAWTRRVFVLQGGILYGLSFLIAGGWKWFHG